MPLNMAANMAFICGSHLPPSWPHSPLSTPSLPTAHMHRLQLTHSFIHLAAVPVPRSPNPSIPPASSISWAFRTQAGSKNPNHKEPSNGKPQPLHATQPACHSATLRRSSPWFCVWFGFGIELVGTLPALLPASSCVLLRRGTRSLYVLTHLCMHPRVYILLMLMYVHLHGSKNMHIIKYLFNVRWLNSLLCYDTHMDHREKRTSTAFF